MDERTNGYHINAKKKQHVTDIFHMIRNEGLSFRDIERRLKSQGVEISHNTIRRIARNKVYVNEE